MRRALGITILLLQVGAIVYARFSPSRYFCWAPHDSQADYRITVIADGAPLTDEQVERRYRIAPSGVEARSIYAVTSLVEQYETTIGKGERVDVTVTYRINGREPQQWRFSAP
jgi:hypothetical protein